MDISFVGINFNSAPIDIREKFHLTSKRRMEIYSSSAIQTVILTTCNRTEFYFASELPLTPENILEILCQIYPENKIDPAYLYYDHGKEVVEHLLKLASGLESMILGETEILGQIVNAFQIAVESGGKLGLLDELFKKTISHARRIRARSRIGDYSLSLVSLVIKEIKQELAHAYSARAHHSYSGKRALILGNGEIAQKMARAISYHDITATILTRGQKNQMETIPDIKYIFGWENLKTALVENELIITATAAPHLVLKEEHFPSLVGKILIDLSFPRNIDPFVTKSVDCLLWDLEYFHQVSNANQILKKQAMEVASVLCRESAIVIWSKLSSAPLPNIFTNVS